MDDPSSQIRKRIADLEAWIKENAPDCVTEQRHLDADTSERSYWNYGYLMGLRDVLNLFGEQETKH